MGDTARALGIGPEIEFEGKSYRIDPLTYELHAKFELWLLKQAAIAAQQLRPVIGDDEYSRMLGKIAQDRAAGIYSFGQEASQKAAGSLPGIKELIRLSLSKNHPEVDAEFVDRFFEAKVKEIQAAVDEANADPLPMTPPRETGAA